MKKVKIIIKNIIIEGDAKEIAALMFPAQERQPEVPVSLDGFKCNAVGLYKAIGRCNKMSAKQYLSRRKAAMASVKGR